VLALGPNTGSLNNELKVPSLAVRITQQEYPVVSAFIFLFLDFDRFYFFSERVFCDCDYRKEYMSSFY